MFELLLNPLISRSFKQDCVIAEVGLIASIEM